MRKNKKAVSDVVITILIILITIGFVGSIYYVVKGFINPNFKPQNQTICSNVSSPVYNITEEDLNLTSEFWIAPLESVSITQIYPMDIKCYQIYEMNGQITGMSNEQRELFDYFKYPCQDIVSYMESNGEIDNIYTFIGANFVSNKNIRIDGDFPNKGTTFKNLELTKQKMIMVFYVNKHSRIKIGEKISEQCQEVEK